MSYELRKLTKQETLFAEKHYHLIPLALYGVPSNAYEECYDAAVDAFLEAIEQNDVEDKALAEKLTAELHKAVCKRKNLIVSRTKTQETPSSNWRGSPVFQEEAVAC